MNGSQAAPDASALSDLDVDVTACFEPLQKLSGLVGTGDDFVIHPRDHITSAQSHLSKDAAGSDIREHESGGSPALLERRYIYLLQYLVEI